ncbi:MAG: dynamin family protein [Leptospiraceae bacterium]|nr:dynamin family protein [Leptospiraceae bacterium]MCP5495974.1 dynamin family protein [Leptospiraceae bacterium]
MNYLIDTIDESIRNLNNMLGSYDFLSSMNSRLASIEEKIAKSEIIIPIFGEFSSGKSSLINSLIKENVLPTDILPTTAVINEVRFNYEQNKIEVVTRDSIVNELKDYSESLNFDLSVVKTIKVYRNSRTVDKGIVIVDTPGLSSDITEHEEALVDYAPKSDAIFLAIDANQGVTRTLIEFLKTVDLLNKDVYYIITKSDKKSPNELYKIRKYLKEELDITPTGVVTTSSRGEKIKELTNLLFTIYRDKERIILKNISNDLINICKECIAAIDMQINSSDLNTRELNEKIEKITKESDLIYQKIQNEIQHFKEKVETVKSNTFFFFKKSLKSKINDFIKIAFQENENLELEFESTIKTTIETSIREVYQKEIEQATMELSDVIKNIPNKVNIESIEIAGYSKALTEIIVLVLMNFVLPGGFVSAIFGRVVIKFAQKWPMVNNFWSAITKPLESIIQSSMSLAAKGYIQKQIEDAITEACDYFKKELNYISKDIMNNIENQLQEKLSENKQTLIDSLVQLKKERNEKEEYYTEYIGKLKRTRETTNEIIIKLVAV